MGPTGRGWGAGVVVKTHPAPEAGVTVEARKTSCRRWGKGSIDRREKRLRNGSKPVARRVHSVEELHHELKINNKTVKNVACQGKFCRKI